MPTHAKASAPSPTPPLADAKELVHLVYSSVAVAPLSVGRLAELLDTSRDHNRRHGITGLLVYADAGFLQCLEGPALAVRQTYERIRADSRHRDIEQRLYESIDARSFASWDMACTEIGDAAWQRLSAARWKSHLQPRSGDSSGFTLMEHLWTSQDPRSGADRA